MLVHQQRREAGHVRARHRRAAEEVEVATSVAGGATAARMSWPGAITSGFSMSPPPAASGPRDEKLAVNGAGALKTSVDALILAVGPAVAAYALTAARSVFCRCTVGTKWKSAFSEFAVGLIEDHPDPARLLDRQALVDACADAAIADDDLAGHLRRIERDRTVGRAEAQRERGRIGARTPAAIESMSGAGPTACGDRRTAVGHAVAERHRALAVAIVRSGRDRRQPRTRVRDGARRRPLFPAEAATKMPASAANRNETSTGSRKFVCVPETE